MIIDRIVWAEVVIRSNEIREWENCTIDYSAERGTAWVKTEDIFGDQKSVLMRIYSIQELSPYCLKAKGEILVGDIFHEATLEARF